MVMEVVGLIVVIIHITVMAALVLWMGLGKPTSAEKFRMRFKQEFLGIGKQTK